MPIHQQDNLHKQKNRYATLGKKIETYQAVWVRNLRWELVVGGVFLLILSSIFFTINLINMIDSINQHGRAILLNQFLPGVITPCILFLFGGLILILGIRHWQDSIILYENGFLRKRGKRSEAWVWSEITSLDSYFREIIFAGSTISYLEEIRLKGHNSRSISIRISDQNCTELTAKIRHNTLPLLYQHAVKALKNGKMIQFHNELIAKLGGIEFDRRHYPWSDLSIQKKKNGMIEIKAQKDQQTIFRRHFQKIENFDTLTHLIKFPPTTPKIIRDNTSYAEYEGPGQYFER